MPPRPTPTLGKVSEVGLYGPLFVLPRCCLVVRSHRRCRFPCPRLLLASSSSFPRQSLSSLRLQALRPPVEGNDPEGKGMKRRPSNEIPFLLIVFRV